MKPTARRWRAVTAVILGMAFLAGAGERGFAADAVTVFAAASTTDALGEIGKEFMEATKVKVGFSFASSSTLARQIENGAPAHVFVSADQEWMDYLAERRLLVQGTRFDLVGNRLVLITPADRPLDVRVDSKLDLGGLLGGGRLATGDPDHVPVGKYARAALAKLGLWSQVEGRLARADNVRAALALVERGEAPLGIVYQTDAILSRGVRVAGVIPEENHLPIRYPAAMVAGKDTPDARRFLDFLRGAEAKAVFQRHGFSLP
jgi:molybdate transport system substrate-binding protein